MNKSKSPAWKKKVRQTRIQPVEVVVYDNDVEKALKVLKNKMANEGIPTEIKKRRHYKKPSDIKREKRRETERKMMREKFNK